MKKCMMVMLCLLFVCVAIGAQADDAAIQKAISMGKSFELRAIEFLPPEEAFAGTPVAVSPDGQTVLWRTSLGGCLTRNGRVIPIRPAPRRGAGDPYHYLESEMNRLLKRIPGAEGVSWSPDGHYIVFSNKSETMAGKDIVRPLDLILLDTGNGEVFQALAFEIGSDNYKRGIANKTYGTVVEARFDLTGEYVYFIGRIDAYSVQHSLYRYCMKTGETEMMMENVFVGPEGRCLFPEADGSWLLMTLKDGYSNDQENCETCIRFWPDESAVRVERGFPYYAMEGFQNCYSEKTRYGLILSGCQDRYNMMNDFAKNAGMTPIYGLYGRRRLNRIIGGDVDLNEYWDLAYNPESREVVGLTKTEPQLINIMERFSKNQKLTESELQYLKDNAMNELLTYFPHITCICQSPGGHYAMICTFGRRPDSYWLLDIEKMEIVPVKIPDGLEGIAAATMLSQGFRPGMMWNDDDTLLILQNGKVGTYQLEIR